MKNKYVVQSMNETANYIDDPVDCSGYEDDEDVFEKEDIDAFNFE
jgi:hypothetical protein